MAIEDRLTKIALYDCYFKLLTQKQQKILSMHYIDDCGLAEIGQVFGISRQAVLDTIKKAENELYEVENKLKMVHLSKHIKADLADLSKLKEIQQSDKAKKIITRLSNRV